MFGSKILLLGIFKEIVNEWIEALIPSKSFTKTDCPHANFCCPFRQRYPILGQGDMTQLKLIKTYTICIAYGSFYYYSTGLLTKGQGYYNQLTAFTGPMEPGHLQELLDGWKGEKL